MTEHGLFRVRIALIQAFLQEKKYDGILLSRTDNFAMATGGKRNYIWTYTDIGANALFVTRHGKVFFVGNNIEVTRVMDEELGVLGCETITFPWFNSTPSEEVAKRFSGMLVSDDGSLGPNVHDELAVIRALLTGEELEKYRRLGKLAGDAMTATLEAIEIGMTEADVAAILHSEGAKRRCEVPVALVAADKRISKYRHPLPTKENLLPGGHLHERAILGYVMVVGCFMIEGLVASITRFKALRDLPEHTKNYYRAICGVDARMQEASKPGTTLGTVFEECQKAYSELGFSENEWHNHHQGGSTGYAGRTCKGKPGETFPILDHFWSEKVKEILGEEVAFGMAFAWNPSAPGVKSEDTFILLPDGTQEIVTRTPSFPKVNLPAVLKRPTHVEKSGILGLEDS